MLAEILRPELAHQPPEPVDYREGVIVYGAGKGGDEFGAFAEAHGIPIRFFCDDDRKRQNSKLRGRPVQAGTALESHPDVPVVIALANFAPVMERLRTLGVRRLCFSDDFLVHHVPGRAREKWGGHFDRAIIDGAWEAIQELHEALVDEESRRVLQGLLKYRLSRSLAGLVVSDYPQYANPAVQAAAKDVVLDGGGWIGDTAEQFAKAAGSGGRVHPFEPTPATFRQLCENIERAGLGEIVKPVNAGLGEREGSARFCTSEGGSGDFYVSAGGGGDITVRITAIDEFCRKEGIRPTMIKMDIEGSESAAIRGAEATIRTLKPKLAICVYHKPEDLWDIFRQLRALNAGYRFRLGQHARGITETVLYAIDG